MWLTSEISSSASMIFLLAMVLHCGTSAAGEADAPVASDNDNPAAPNAGTAFLRLFRFEVCLVCDMARASTPEHRAIDKKVRKVSTPKKPKTKILDTCRGQALMRHRRHALREEAIFSLEGAERPRA